MKYCSSCKLRGKAADSVCLRCGKPFRMLGVKGRRANEESPQTKPTPAPRESNTNELNLQLAGMEHRVSQAARRVRWLTALAGLMLLSLLGFLVYLRYSFVMQFAELDELAASRMNSQPNTISIRYRPLTTGKVEFVRKTNQRTETLVNHSMKETEGDDREFRWTDSDRGPVKVEVRHRKGWSVVTRLAFDSPTEM